MLDRINSQSTAPQLPRGCGDGRAVLVGGRAAMKRRWVRDISGPLLLIVVLAIAFEWITRWYTSTGGEHLTVAEATDRGIELSLPTEAEDIRFSQHLRPEVVVDVDFAVSEAAFLAWAERMGWNVRETGGTADSSETDAGFRYTDFQPGKPNTTFVKYDRHTGRAYYTFRSEPFRDP